MKAFVTLIIVSLQCAVFAFTNPVVTGVTATQRTDGSNLVDIWYNLYDADGDPCSISLLVSDNNGASFLITPSQSNVSGNIGTGQISGNNKHIVWNAGAEAYSLDGSNYQFKIIADDHTTPPPPANFVLVTGSGSISSFYLDRYELTNAEWFAVMGSGTSDNYPRFNVSWFNAVEYCNRRSMQDLLTPCYSYGTYGTNPANWPAGWYYNDANHVNISCDFSANGYRLPTVAEWIYAANGGLLTHGYTYSGSNDLNQVGWYVNNSGGAAHPVAQKLPNELGVFDMSGNVWEWCWDILSTNNRTIRGGFWGAYDWQCTNTYESWSPPGLSSNRTGFRLLRRAN